MSEWQTIEAEIPSGTKFVVFLDAEKRMACFAPRKELLVWRKSLWHSLKLHFGFIRPKATHFFVLPNIPEPPK
jgi:hypothetical protein